MSQRMRTLLFVVFADDPIRKHLAGARGGVCERGGHRAQGTHVPLDGCTRQQTEQNLNVCGLNAFGNCGVDVFGNYGPVWQVVVVAAAVVVVCLITRGLAAQACRWVHVGSIKSKPRQYQIKTQHGQTRLR